MQNSQRETYLNNIKLKKKDFPALTKLNILAYDNNLKKKIKLICEELEFIKPTHVDEFHKGSCRHPIGIPANFK